MTPGIPLLRAMLSIAQAATYVGWSDDFDRSFDACSSWLLATNGPGPLSFCRLTMPRSGKDRLPIEHADGFPAVHRFGRCCEINNLLHVREHPMFARRVILAALEIIETAGFDTMLCVVDPENVDAMRLNIDDIRCLDTDVRLRFPDFRYRDDDSVVEWCLLSQSREHRGEAIRSLRAEFGDPRPGDHEQTVEILQTR